MAAAGCSIADGLNCVGKLRRKYCVKKVIREIVFVEEKREAVCLSLKFL